MDREYKKILQAFQCDYYRYVEEMFSQTFTENENIRLFFINENKAFTDGKNIVVDPARHELFCDTLAFKKAEEFLSLPNVFSQDPWNALGMITRCQNIHECLHILYTDFTFPDKNDARCNTKIKLKVMGLISNIIEDAYIEAAGASVFDNLDIYLKFSRVLMAFATSSAETTGEIYPVPIICYLNYMINFLLYPFLKQEEPAEEIASYVEKTKPLFLEASIAPSPMERNQYCSKIFEIILPLIPDDDVIDLNACEKILGGVMTHSADSKTLENSQSKGKAQKVNTRLFTNLSHSPKEGKDYNVQIIKIVNEFSKHREKVYEIIEYEGRKNIYYGNYFDCSFIHNKIRINEIKPKININFKRAYQNIYNRYKISINSYNSKFAQLLNLKSPIKEEKLLYGAGISSKFLWDPKKRYWYKTTEGIDIPDLSILLLIDGSGSMSGIRRESAMVSSLILHEVLKRQGICHAIVEHRARFENPEIDINILVDFYAKDEEKYNLIKISSYGDNRDALALFWAERYINNHTNNENKLIIVISDGIPAHEADDYYPPASIKDTHNAVAKISNRGTNIIAIALDAPDSFDCYETLKEIYPNIVSCNDLATLPGKLVGVILKQLNLS